MAYHTAVLGMVTVPSSPFVPANIKVELHDCSLEYTTPATTEPPQDVAARAQMLADHVNSLIEGLGVTQIYGFSVVRIVRHDQAVTLHAFFRA